MIIKDITKILLHGVGYDEPPSYPNATSVVRYFDTENPKMRWEFYVDGEDNIIHLGATEGAGTVTFRGGQSGFDITLITVEQAEIIRSKLDVLSLIEDIELAARHSDALKKLEELKVLGFVFNPGEEDDAE